MVLVSFRLFGNTQPNSSFHLELHCADLLDESKDSLNVLLEAPMANPGGEEFINGRRDVMLPPFIHSYY